MVRGRKGCGALSSTAFGLDFPRSSGALEILSPYNLAGYNAVFTEYGVTPIMLRGLKAMYVAKIQRRQQHFDISSRGVDVALGLKDATRHRNSPQ